LPAGLQVIDVNDHAPEVSVLMLLGSDRLDRHARRGDRIARVSVSDRDAMDDSTSLSVQLQHSNACSSISPHHYNHSAAGVCTRPGISAG